MGNFILLLFCFAAGIFLRRYNRLPENTPAVLNAFIINIGLPAMALAYLHDIELSPSLFYAVLAPWVMFLIGAVLLWQSCKALHLPRETTGCVILVGGLANTSFIGIPMIEAFYGATWMGIGIAMDQLGSYVILSLLGIAIARLFAAGPRPDFREVAIRILQFPPFIATIAAVLLQPVTYAEWLDTLLTRLAATVAPLALVSVGYQLSLSDVKGKVSPLVLGLSYNLVIGPLIIFAIFVWLLDIRGTILQVTIFEVAMAPMIGASIVAMNNDLDPSLATLLVALGVPLSFLTLLVWYQVLGGF
ncbi:MAG TPA: AEC family transporter [Afifellaceae bacterium]|nr:AEC family transporter [Afifellaceae bacterium]